MAQFLTHKQWIRKPPKINCSNFYIKKNHLYAVISTVSMKKHLKNDKCSTMNFLSYLFNVHSHTKHGRILSNGIFKKKHIWGITLWNKSSTSLSRISPGRLPTYRVLLARLLIFPANTFNVQRFYIQQSLHVFTSFN